MPDVIAILNLQNDNDATEEVDAAIRAAEKEFEEEGKLFDAREMLSGLRRKYFGSWYGGCLLYCKQFFRNTNTEMISMGVLLLSEQDFFLFWAEKSDRMEDRKKF